MSIEFEPQTNESGDARVAAQGFGRVTREQPPIFDPVDAADAAFDYFSAHGFAVLGNCLTAGELAHLNEFCDRTQQQRPAAWGLGDRRKPHHRNQGLIFSLPLLDHPELDPYTQHPRSYPLVERLLGGEGSARFSEFNFREAPANSGFGAMNFHHDAVVADRLLRQPYMPCDWLCAIHYLTDVAPGTPAFCVVPRSNRYQTLREAYDALGDAYREVPLYGAAGTCVLYDSATFHTRLDGDGRQRRRTWHQYYARGGWLPSTLPTTKRYVRAPTPALTDWNLLPQRLALHPDPAKRLFFSHWNTAQCEWVASGFDPEVRRMMPRGEQ
ncbi:MAG: phytanoyl-CoA dioxygenase family protein [Pseudomonadales bacterium]